MVADQRVHELSEKECLQHLQYSARVGRLAFVLHGRPMVLPVNYLADDHSIVFVTAPGTKLSAIGGGTEVAFEIDDNRALEHSGWSVLVHGPAHEISDEAELEGLRRGPLRSWATQASQHWVRITIEEITGRRVGEDE